LIMVVAATSFHTYLSLDTWAAILESLVGFGVLTIFLFMLLYYLC
jgi:hypothetical protein